MLHLTRHVGESIKIGDDITVTVSAIVGNRVRVSVDAPREVPVLRDDAIRKEKKLDSNLQPE